MLNFNQKLQPKILVIGDLMIDKYLWGECNRVSPEAPVQVINVSKETKVLGGAGNVAHNLVTLGSNVKVLSVIGGCKISNELKNLFKEINLPTDYLIEQKNRVTSKKTRIISSQQQVIRYDIESDDDIDIVSEKKLIGLFKSVLNDFDLVILSDYGKGVLTTDVTKEIIKIANSNNIKVIVDPKGSDYSKYNSAYLLTPNKKEACEATGINISDKDSLEKALVYLKNSCDLKTSLITLSEDGIAFFDDELSMHPTVAREVYDVTGAGDTVLASLGFALSCNYSIDEAIEFANLAAGIVVGKIGSATTTLDEIAEYKSSLHKSTSDSHIKTRNEIQIISKRLKNNGRKLVFTNGCFDIIHAGHIRYLETTKSYGDVMIVGLNSDRSVRALKGESRPVNSQEDRALILASIEAVDYVVIFDEDTPYELIKAIRPHILIKGGDYESKTIIGKDLVEECKIVQFVEGKSTTKTIEKIRNL